MYIYEISKNLKQYYDIIHLTKTTAAQNEVALSYRSVRELYFLAVVFVSTIYLPKTKKFGCVGRGDLTSLFFSKVVKY